MDDRASAVARLPGWALGVSLALHGVFIAAPAWHAQRQARPPLPLLATLRPAAPVRLDAPTVPAPIASAAARPPARPAPRPETKAAPQEYTASEPTAPVALSLAPLPEAPAPPAQRIEAPPPEPPAAALASYARFLAGLLAQRRDYPRLAAQRGWQGEVRLGVQVARKGAIVAVHLLQSSGFEVLDRHALQLVRDTVTLPQLPEELIEREFRIVVPIHYKLEKTT